MKNEIEETLKVLIGLPLWNAGRAVSLEWFDFGWKRTPIVTRKGNTKLIGEYTIHTEAAWHIANTNGIVVASNDRLYPAGDDPYKDLLEFDWDRPNVNRCDERMTMFLGTHKDSPLIVESLNANNLGAVKLILSNAHILEIFPDSSLDCEYWRFFELVNNNKHFVVTAHGIE